jgi:hypothetical protein
MDPNEAERSYSNPFDPEVGARETGLELQSDELSKYASVSTTNQLLPVSRPRARISSCCTRREQMTLDNQRPARLLGRALAL